MSDPQTDLSLLSDRDLQRLLQCADDHIARMESELRAARASRQRIQAVQNDREHAADVRRAHGDR